MTSVRVRNGPDGHDACGLGGQAHLSLALVRLGPAVGRHARKPIKSNRPIASVSVPMRSSCLNSAISRQVVAGSRTTLRTNSSGFFAIIAVCNIGVGMTMLLLARQPARVYILDLRS